MSSDDTDNASGSAKQTGNQATQPAAKKSKLAPWFRDGIHSRRIWKTWARCMLCTLATISLLVIQPTLNEIGGATFFAVIMSQILPPSLALSLLIFAFTTIVVGMCLGWAWGAAAMAAALRARNVLLTQEQIRSAQAGFDKTTDIQLQFQDSVFRGDFLDAGSSAVYGVFLFFGAYFFGFLRAKMPRLTVMALFGTIILDLMASFGPLFPAAQYTLARQLLLPSAHYIAIAIASTVLFFPQSLNHMVLDGIATRPLTSLLDLLKLQDEVLATHDHETWSKLATQIRLTRLAQGEEMQEVEGSMSLLGLEVTRGRTSAKDLGDIFAKVKVLWGRLYGLSNFVIMTTTQNASQRQFLDGVDHVSSPRSRKHLANAENGRKDGTDYASLIPKLEASTRELRQACQAGLSSAITWLKVINHARWFSAPKDAEPTSTREANLATLKRALQEFRDEKHHELLAPYRELFDPASGELTASVLEATSTCRELFRCYIFTTNLIYFSMVLVEFLELLLRIENACPSPRFQWPTAFTKHLVKAANDREGGGGNPLEMGPDERDEGTGTTNSPNDSTETLVNEKKSVATSKTKRPKRSYRRDPDAEDPRNVFQKIGRAVGRIWSAMSSAEGIFALKYGLVSVAVWVPAVCPSSAKFVYENRGLWALIMAQSGLGVYTGEQVYSFLTRMAGTAVGLLLGAVVWYIGSGNGPGNPYGVAAASVVFLAPFIFLRIVSPKKYLAFFIMAPVTIVFVVGYSWVDNHIYESANQGDGIGLAGKRALLVVIGFTAGFLIMLFPKPVSAKLRVRRTLARIVSDLGDLYGSEISGFELEIEVPEKGMGEEVDITARQTIYRGQFMKILTRLGLMMPQMGFARLEPGLRGPWPAAKYMAIVRHQGDIISGLALLSAAYGRLERKWVKRLAEQSDLLHPAMIGDTCALFSLLHHSLLHGHALPPTIPIFDKLIYHQKAKLALRSTSVPGQADAGLRRRKGAEEDIDIDMDDHEHENLVGNFGGVFNWQTIHDEQFAIYATANVALVHLTTALNDLHRTVRDLVGEKELEGFELAQARWAGLETA